MRIVLLIGDGTKVPAMLKCVSSINEAEVVYVLSCKGEGAGLESARKHKIKTGILKWEDYKGIKGGRNNFSFRVRNLLKSYQADLVVMAGWKVLMPPSFVSEFGERTINIHPSILPSYPGDGKKAIRAQWEARFDRDAPPSGCTLHYVDGGVDTGNTIMKGIVYPRDFLTIEDFSDAIHRKEDEVLCRGIKKLVLQGRGE